MKDYLLTIQQIITTLSGHKSRNKKMSRLRSLYYCFHALTMFYVHPTNPLTLKNKGILRLTLNNILDL